MLVLETIGLVLLVIALLCACGAVVSLCFGNGFSFEGFFWWLFFGRDAFEACGKGIIFLLCLIAEMWKPDS